jgi:hypothetical protein
VPALFAATPACGDGFHRHRDHRGASAGTVDPSSIGSLCSHGTETLRADGPARSTTGQIPTG